MSKRAYLWLIGIGILALALTACERSSRDSEVKSDDSQAKAGSSEPGFTVGWSRLQSGMKSDEVLRLLDEPKSIKATTVNTYWYYSDREADGPHVVFDSREMTVDRWRAPK